MSPLLFILLASSVAVQGRFLEAGPLSSSCVGRCGDRMDSSQPCQCNTSCSNFGDCCSDYSNACGTGAQDVTNTELKSISNTLFSMDKNRVPDKGVVIDFNSNTLFTYVDESHFDKPTYSTFIKLLDNYTPQTGIAEPSCPTCRREEQAYLSAILETPLMLRLWEFLQARGYASSSLQGFKDQLYTYWFRHYSRSGGPLDSSGFEHVFVGEIKNNKVSGFHNWVQYYFEQEEGEIVYQSKLQNCEPGLVATRMLWLGYPKSIQSMLVRTSPEMDMALFTLCYLVRSSRACDVNLGGHNIRITTYPMNNVGFPGVGTAYPDCR